MVNLVIQSGTQITVYAILHIYIYTQYIYHTPFFSIPMTVRMEDKKPFGPHVAQNHDTYQVSYLNMCHSMGVSEMGVPPSLDGL